MLAATITAIVAILATANGTLDWKGRPIGADFSQAHAVRRMVLDGHVFQVWDWPTLFRVQQALHGSTTVDLYGWHYPPPFLLVAALLATHPYFAITAAAWLSARALCCAIRGSPRRS